MKKLNVLLSIFVLLLSANAFAQIDGDSDGIGMYFDLGATEMCKFTGGAFEPVAAYLCITNPTDPAGVSGWEASVLVEGGAVGAAWTLAAGLDVDTTAEGFQVGIGVAPAALEAAPVVILATWNGYIMAPTDVVNFTIYDIPGSVSFDGVPGYGSGADAGVLLPLQVSTGFPFTVCAQINACDVVAAENMSMSQVKNLFQ